MPLNFSFFICADHTFFIFKANATHESSLLLEFSLGEKPPTYIAKKKGKLHVIIKVKSEGWNNTFYRHLGFSGHYVNI